MRRILFGMGEEARRVRGACCEVKLAGDSEAVELSLRRSVRAMRASQTNGDALMETLRESEIQLIQDKEFEEDVGPYYGKYLGTFISAHGQVRADLFDAIKEVNAYISFPTGRNAGNVEDRYVELLYSYAASQGFRDRFRFLYAQ
jgi:hypothetical protein